eukprot:10541182-Heterocapsa_arctica.AAC.1
MAASLRGRRSPVSAGGRTTGSSRPGMRPRITRRGALVVRCRSSCVMVPSGRSHGSPPRLSYPRGFMAAAGAD